MGDVSEFPWRLLSPNLSDKLDRFWKIQQDLHIIIPEEVSHNCGQIIQLFPQFIMVKPVGNQTYSAFKISENYRRLNISYEFKVSPKTAY